MVTGRDFLWCFRAFSDVRGDWCFLVRGALPVKAEDRTKARSINSDDERLRTPRWGRRSQVLFGRTPRRERCQMTGKPAIGRKSSLLHQSESSVVSSRRRASTHFSKPSTFCTWFSRRPDLANGPTVRGVVGIDVSHRRMRTCNVWRRRKKRGTNRHDRLNMID